MSNSEHVKAWRRRTRERIVESLGGKCVCCGYDQLQLALETHHLDPNTKDFSMGETRADIISWERMTVEIRKCVLVCVRCHMEIHSGLRVVPVGAVRFNESMSEYRKKNEQLMDDCPICGKKKSIKLITCSHECGAKKANKADWSSLREMMKTMNRSQIADRLGVSWTAVNKHMKKMNI